MVALAVGLSLTSAVARVIGAGGGVRWMADNSGSSLMVEGFGAAAQQSRTVRSNKTRPVSFRRFRVGIPLIYRQAGTMSGTIEGTVLTVTGWTLGKFEAGDVLVNLGSGTAIATGTTIVQQLTNTNASGIGGREGTYEVSISQAVPGRSLGHAIKDIWFDRPIRFQVGFLPTFLRAMTGIPAPMLGDWGGGQTSVVYDPATHDRSKGRQLLSPVWDMGQTVPAGTEFDIRLAVVTAAAEFPITHSRRGTATPWIGSASSASDLIASGDMATRTTYTAYPSGGSDSFDNLILYHETSDQTETVVSIGDSLLHAVAYDFGDEQGVGGMAGRGLKSKGRMHVNFGKGSDGDFNLVTPAKWSQLRALISEIHALAPITRLLHTHGHNDTTKPYSTAIRQASTFYPKWTPINSGGAGMYICTKAGTTGTGSLTGTGRNIADGTAEWAFINASASGIVAAAVAQVAQQAAVTDQLRALLPDLPLIGITIGPATTTKTSGVPQVGWGDASSRRGLVNAIRRGGNGFDLLGYSAIIDPNAAIELNFPADTSLWADTNDTPEGVHHLDVGAIKGAAIFAASTAL